MRQRQISSVPDWTLQTAPTTFFRSALTRLLQTTSSILPDEIAAPTAATPSRVRTKPNQLRVWAGARRRRTGLSSRFPGFQSAGWAYPYVSCMFLLRPPNHSKPTWVSYDPAAPIPCVFIPLPVSFDITDQFAPDTLNGESTAYRA